MKFIEVESYDLLQGKNVGKRMISTFSIKELVGGDEITRIKLVDGDYVDVRKSLEEVKAQIEG